MTANPKTHHFKPYLTNNIEAFSKRCPGKQVSVYLFSRLTSYIPMMSRAWSDLKSSSGVRKRSAHLGLGISEPRMSYVGKQTSRNKIGALLFSSSAHAKIRLGLSCFVWLCMGIHSSYHRTINIKVNRFANEREIDWLQGRLVKYSENHIHNFATRHSFSQDILWYHHPHPPIHERISRPQ